MPRRIYTLTVLVGALSWLLVGLHVPLLHDLTHAGVPRRWMPLAVLALLLVLAIADTWALLRAPAPWAVRSESRPPAA